MNAVANSASKPKKVNIESVYADYLIMLLAPCYMAIHYYGIRSLLVVAVSVATAMITDAAAGFAINKKIKFGNTGCIFAGAAIALMMPVNVPLYVPVFASFFAVAVAMAPFGGSENAPFVPAAAGFAFASVCFKEQVFSYAVGSQDSVFGAESLGSMLMKGSSIHIGTANVFDILIGNVAGPMGTGCIILMLVSAVYLLVRRPASLLSTVGFLAACILVVIIFPRVTASLKSNLIPELCSGSLMFAAVFLITDPVTLPHKNLNKIIYGALCGILCMAMRRMGAYEETVCFAVILANALRPIFDSAIDNMPKIGKKSPRREVTE